MTIDRLRIGRGETAVLFFLVAAATFTACDFDVTNPGPVQDQFLNDPEAFPAVVNGVGRAFADALNQVSYTGGIVAREIHPGGSSGNFGVAVSIQPGKLPNDQVNTHWSTAQQARWQADAAIARLEEVMSESDFTSSALVAQAYLWQGYAYRLLGENMCELVIDGGAPQSISVARERAEEAFTNAMTVAAAAGEPEIEMAARAGRASVRVMLDDWSSALSDAALVPDDFTYQIPYYDLGDEEEYNRVYWASAEQPFKAHTVWNTVNKEYYETTNDPRVPWMWTDKVGDAAIACCGQVPWWPQQKYTSKESPIRVSSGSEMRLIEAEGALRSGDWTGAMTIINQLRANVDADPPLQPWVAANETEAWTHLKRERGIELWLEARRLGDLRRWKGGSTPGALDPLEDDPVLAHLDSDRDLCFPISLNEIETNPNISLPEGGG